MKHTTRLLALLLALALCAGLLAGCGGSGDADEDVADQIRAAQGGSITLPEGFSASGHLSSQIAGDTLYVCFSGIQYRNTGYFAPAGGSITVTAFATTDNELNRDFKLSLWKQVDGGAAYVNGATVYYTADGSCYTYTYEGLDPASKYRFTISYDSPSYYITGQFSVAGLATAEQSDEELDEQAA